MDVCQVCFVHSMHVINIWGLIGQINGNDNNYNDMKIVITKPMKEPLHCIPAHLI